MADPFDPAGYPFYMADPTNPADHFFYQGRGLVNADPHRPPPITSANGALGVDADDEGDEQHFSSSAAPSVPAVGRRDDDHERERQKKHAAPVRSRENWLSHAALIVTQSATRPSGASPDMPDRARSLIPPVSRGAAQQPSYPPQQPYPANLHVMPGPHSSCPLCGTPYQWGPSGWGPPRAPGPRSVYGHEQTRGGPQLGHCPACHSPTSTQLSSTGASNRFLSSGRREYITGYRSSSASQHNLSGVTTTPHANTNNTTRSYRPAAGFSGGATTTSAPSQGYQTGVTTTLYTDTSNTPRPYRSVAGSYGNATTTGTSGRGYQTGGRVTASTPTVTGTETRNYASSMYDGSRSQTALSTRHLPASNREYSANFASMSIGGGGPALAREQRSINTATMPPDTSTPLPLTNSVTNVGSSALSTGSQPALSTNDFPTSFNRESHHNTANFASMSIGGGGPVPARQREERSINTATMPPDTSTPLPLINNVTMSGVQPCLQGTRTETRDYALGMYEGSRSQTALSTDGFSTPFDRESHHNTANFASVSAGKSGPVSASEQRAASTTPLVTSTSLSSSDVTSQEGHANGVDATYSGSTNEALVSDMIIRGLIKSDAVADVMRAVDRSHYVTDKATAYSPVTHFTEKGVAVAAPHIYAVILESILPYIKAGSHVLDVGTSTGLFAAMLHHRTGKDGVIVSLSPSDEAVELAKQNLIADGLDQALQGGKILFVKGDEKSGYAPCAPYDMIHVSNVMEEISPPLLTQLASPGRMVISVRTDGRDAMIQVDKDAAGNVSQKELSDLL